MPLFPFIYTLFNRNEKKSPSFGIQNAEIMKTLCIYAKAQYILFAVEDM